MSKWRAAWLLAILALALAVPSFAQRPSPYIGFSAGATNADLRGVEIDSR
jgi:hypothetical protein